MIKLTVEIVSTYLANNALPTDEIPALIRATYSALINASSAGQAIDSEPALPAVTIKKSVTPEAIICLDCGKKFSMLKRHLRTDHGTTPEDYRLKWNLPASYPMVAPDYAARRSKLAVKIGLGHKPRKAKTAAPMITEKRGRKKEAAE
jgi:predicted transcriptional regulator